MVCEKSIHGGKNFGIGAAIGESAKLWSQVPGQVEVVLAAAFAQAAKSLEAVYKIEY